MTGREKHELRADLLLRLDDARTEFVYLRERVYRLADELEDISRTLRRNATVELSFLDAELRPEIGSGLKAEHRTVLDFRKTTDVIEELSTARRRLLELHQRARKLGLSVSIEICDR